MATGMCATLGSVRCFEVEVELVILISTPIPETKTQIWSTICGCYVSNLRTLFVRINSAENGRINTSRNLV